MVVLISANAQNVQENSQKFGRLLRLIESYYVDSTNISDLTEKAIVSMLQELDPHSVYITKDEVERMNEPLQANFEGIGITFNILKDTLLVLSTVPGGPSEKVGLDGRRPYSCPSMEKMLQERGLKTTM
jgi:carboxyl-terminal processing protease